jgi:hypothetical protein
MPANVEIQNDAGVPITTWNFGAVGGGSYTEQKFIIENTGADQATSVGILVERLVQNDGIDFITIAPDSGGNPGTYISGTINVGTLAAGAEYAFWVKVTIPSGTTPRGNPRQFDVVVEYTGT